MHAGIGALARIGCQAGDDQVASRPDPAVRERLFSGRLPSEK